MNFIDLAESLGIDRNSAITVYKRLNGGYFIKIYYSKIPILYPLREWPNLYLKVAKYYPIFAKPGFNEAFTLMVYLDVYSIYGMSSRLLGAEVPLNKVSNEISNIFKSIEELAQKQNIFPYPQDVSTINITNDFDNFVQDLINKRLQEMKMDLNIVLNDLVYDSDIMEEIKVKYPWAKTITRENALKALTLAKRLDDFIFKNIDRLSFLAVGITKYFDELVIDFSLDEAIKKIVKSYNNVKSSEDLVNMPQDNILTIKLKEIIVQMRDIGNYF